MSDGVDHACGCDAPAAGQGEGLEGGGALHQPGQVMVLELRATV